jgi:hypothetical protein
MLPNPKRFVKFFQDFKLPTLSLPISILPKLQQPSNLLSFFLPSTKNYSFSSYPRRLWKQDLSIFELKIMFGKERAKMIRLCPFKEKEGGSPLGGQWKEKEKVFLHLFPLFPRAILLRPLSFSFDIKVLLYHGSRPLFTHFLPFPWPIN